MGTGTVGRVRQRASRWARVWSVMVWKSAGRERLDGGGGLGRGGGLRLGRGGSLRLWRDGGGRGVLRKGGGRYREIAAEEGDELLSAGGEGGGGAGAVDEPAGQVALRDGAAA